MPSHRRYHWIFLTTLVTGGCTEWAEQIRPALENADAAQFHGTLELAPDAVVHATNPRAMVSPDVQHRYDLPIEGPASVRIDLKVGTCGDFSPQLFVLDGDGKHVESAQSHRCVATIETSLASGDYQVIVATSDGMGAYQLEARCPGGCAKESATFAFNRNKAADATSSQELFEVGQHLFTHVFQVRQGLGNGLDGGLGEGTRPNMNIVHSGPFGGPDSQSCVSCHNIGGIHGGGTLASNIFQASDGESRRFALKRNPPPTLGGGVRQAIAKEISAKLKAQAEAGSPGDVLGVENLDGEMVTYGYLNEDGKPVGVGTDGDLVVEPFGWKGRDRTLRDFVKGGFRVHFGIQAEEVMDAHCNTDTSAEDAESYQNSWGRASECHDPDGDTVKRELTRRQLDAMAVYLQQLDNPSRLRPNEEAIGLFYEAECHSCHTRGFALEEPAFVDDQTGEWIEIASSGDPENPHQYEIWSDFKRHWMGRKFTDVKDFPHGDGVIGGTMMVTPPLWDLAHAAPYWHDGTAPTVRDAILMHQGDAETSRLAFEALGEEKQGILIAWLEQLGAKTDE